MSSSSSSSSDSKSVTDVGLALTSSQCELIADILATTSARGLFHPSAFIPVGTIYHTVKKEQEANTSVTASLPVYLERPQCQLILTIIDNACNAGKIFNVKQLTAVGALADDITAYLERNN